MSENDYSWLLKTISNVSTSLNLLYDLKVRIPEIILLSNGEPKIWFYQDKDQIKTRNDNYLKLRLVKEYFTDPQSINDPQVFDFDFMMYNTSKQMMPDAEAKKILFCVNIENPNNDIKIVKKVRKGVAEEIFSQQENMEFCKSWTKIYTYIPNKNAGLYDVFLTKNTKEENPKLKIVKKDFTLKDIEIEEVSDKPDRRKTPNGLFPKNDKALSKNNFSSIASSINNILEKTIKGMVRFLEGKTKMNVGNIHLEIIVDTNYTTWLVGCKAIHFFNSEGEIEREMDKESIDFPKVPLKQFFTCPGTYCHFKGDTNFHQEGDEAINIYGKKTKKREVCEIPFKSVILDVIERCKQIEKLKSKLPDYSEKHIFHYVETHPFEFRKYYSIGEILQSSIFKGYRVSNLYRSLRVCLNCQFIYEKIDGYRVEKVLKPENRRFNTEEAKAAFDKYFEKNGLTGSLNEKERKRVFTDAFFKKLATFDKSIFEILGLEKEVETLEDFFDLTSPNLRKISPSTSRDRDRSINKSLQNTPKTVKFPAIRREIIRDSNNTINKEKLRITDKTKIEVIGIKHYLGHTSHLIETGAGHALSKSSIKLNKLQDKLNRFNNLLESRTQGITQRGDFLPSPMNDVVEPSNFILEDNMEDHKPAIHKKVKELQDDRLSPQRKSINVAVNKLDFISEKEKAALFEKENKQKEKEVQQKNFLARHNMLAQSISSGFKKSNYSSPGLLSQYETPKKIEELVNNFS